MKHSVIRHCRAAATSFVIAAAALAAAADPAPIGESVSSEELCRRANDGDMYAFQALRPRAFKGDDEAMSLYFWKTDDWWRGSSFFPVTIRSVEPETGEDANAATNWIVELLGGIKVRTADPAAAFGAPPGSLPGRRLGVRFRDYKGGWRLDGRPSAMSNACVYAGAIEVRPLLPASEVEAAREIIDRNLDDLTRLTDAGREELERRIGECWVDWGSGISYPTWFFEEGVSFTLTDGYPTDHDFGMAVCKDETPAVTVDGEVVATRGEVAREAIRLHRPTAFVAAAFADDFLLEREAKKHGFATAWAFVHEGLDPPADPDARAFWNGLREGYPNAPSDDARKRFLLLDWQTRFAERRDKLLVALREAATIQYAAPATRSLAAEESHAEDAESAGGQSHAEPAEDAEDRE